MAELVKSELCLLLADYDDHGGREHRGGRSLDDALVELFESENNTAMATVRCFEFKSCLKDSLLRKDLRLHERDEIDAEKSERNALENGGIIRDTGKQQ